MQQGQGALRLLLIQYPDRATHVHNDVIVCCGLWRQAQVNDTLNIAEANQGLSLKAVAADANDSSGYR
tara:strand:+ start:6761 stop:6964 length:204 start_codon:yes stop_codon:yes gene_type:complete